LNIQSAQSAEKKIARWVDRRKEKKKRKQASKPGKCRCIFRKCLFLAVVSRSRAGFGRAFVHGVLTCRHPDTLQEPNVQGTGWPALHELGSSQEKRQISFAPMLLITEAEGEN